MGQILWHVLNWIDSILVVFKYKLQNFETMAVYHSKYCYQLINSVLFGNWYTNINFDLIIVIT